MVIYRSFVVVIASVFLLITVEANDHINQENNYESRIRINMANKIKSNIDTSMDPCGNFFRFACGNLYNSNNKNNPVILDDTEILELLDKYLSKSSSQKSRLLSDYIPKYYNLCMNEMDSVGTELKSVEVIRKIVTSLQLFSISNENHIPYHLQNHEKISRGDSRNHKWAPNIFFRLDVGRILDGNHTAQYLLKINRMLLPEVKYINDTRDIKDSAIFKKLKNFSKKMEIPHNDETTKQIIDMIQLGKNISEIWNTPIDGNEIDTRMTVKELTMKYPDFEWKSVLIARGCKSYDINDKTIVVVASPKQLKKIIDLVNETPFKTVQNYVTWKLVEIPLEYFEKDRGEKLSSKRREYCWKQIEPLFDTDSKYLSEYLSDESENFKQMIRDVNLEFLRTLLRIKGSSYSKKKNFIKRAFTTEMNHGRSEKQLIIAKLRLEDDVSSATDYHRERFLLNDILSKVSCLQLEHEKSFKYSKLSPNGPFLYEDGSLFFPMAFYLKSNYHRDYPDYFNYGASGSSIAFQFLSHFANISKMKNSTLLHKLLEIDEFSWKKFEQFWKSNTGIQPNREMFPIEMKILTHALMIAYRAYNHSYSGSQVFPNFNDYTDNQMFWISSANNWCRKFSTKNSNDLKSINLRDEFLINEAFMTLSDFKNDFKCLSTFSREFQKLVSHVAVDVLQSVLMLGDPLGGLRNRKD